MRTQYNCHILSNASHQSQQASQYHSGGSPQWWHSDHTSQCLQSRREGPPLGIAKSSWLEARRGYDTNGGVVPKWPRAKPPLLQPHSLTLPLLRLPLLLQVLLRLLLLFLHLMLRNCNCLDFTRIPHTIPYNTTRPQNNRAIKYNTMLYGREASVPA